MPLDPTPPLVAVLEGLPLLDFTGPAVLVFVALLVITDKLVWHRRLEKVEKERDEWKDAALRALGVADKMTVAGEITTQVMAQLPDPQREANGP